MNGESVINSPKESHGYRLYPGTFGIIEWLRSTRKNMHLIDDDKAELVDTGELCFAFTRPAAEVTAMTSNLVEKEVRKFMDGLSAEAFHAIKTHAVTEVMRFIDSRTTPKKKPSRPVMSQKKVKR